jgi:hypothetical protein
MEAGWVARTPTLSHITGLTLASLSYGQTTSARVGHARVNRARYPSAGVVSEQDLIKRFTGSLIEGWDGLFEQDLNRPSPVEGYCLNNI